MLGARLSHAPLKFGLAGLGFALRIALRKPLIHHVVDVVVRPLFRSLFLRRGSRGLSPAGSQRRNQLLVLPLEPVNFSLVAAGALVLRIGRLLGLGFRRLLFTALGRVALLLRLFRRRFLLARRGIRLGGLLEGLRGLLLGLALGLRGGLRVVLHSVLLGAARLGLAAEAA